VVLVALTVMAAGTRAGEELHAFCAMPNALPLPAAMAYVTPDAMDRDTAASIVLSTPPPRLMFATAGFTAFAVTQSMPATTCAVVPEPEQLSTRTPTICTPLATPYASPPTVPATCVPWPLQSFASLSLSTASRPLTARPSKSSWVTRTPVSMT
jgi:hypothetical protein